MWCYYSVVILVANVKYSMSPIQVLNDQSTSSNRYIPNGRDARSSVTFLIWDDIKLTSALTHGNFKTVSIAGFPVFKLFC